MRPGPSIPTPLTPHMDDRAALEQMQECAGGSGMTPQAMPPTDLAAAPPASSAFSIADAPVPLQTRPGAVRGRADGTPPHLRSSADDGRPLTDR